MRLRIGYRTIKTAIGVLLATSIAHALGLDSFGSAAVITILCISVTRRNSLRVSWHRFAACMLGMVISMTMFELIGYHPLVLGLFMLLFIPVLVSLKLSLGIVTSSVIVLHVYTRADASMDLFINETLLVVIGIGTALLMNLYMPSSERQLREYKRKIEKNFSRILHEFSTYIRQGDSDWTGAEISETVQLLNQSKSVAIREMDNQILKDDDQYYHYFHMREKQFEILERLMPFITTIHGSVSQSNDIADFLEDLSKAVSPTNHVPYFLGRLEEMRDQFKEMELPTTRDEFEVRSALVYMMHELQQYLLIKNTLWNEKQNNAGNKSPL
ncbi:aromatic acid exporter family protein [Alkalicoccobacillus porphyridii]|uniref:Aromatic acid exporter family protein n=1 Tax=Alkalicoccobacillus porphyridii TaxID=2597270 RepID=A0A553ZZ10_9BACI|nr:aromatic acid exporter family protein [Alkalicoccobacillus porphyridii]TSB46681.1 aromatic acid exporter family protein [Alkalicoccobacillus porphyridii]